MRARKAVTMHIKKLNPKINIYRAVKLLTMVAGILGFVKQVIGLFK
jgi:hypothetical protein